MQLVSKQVLSLSTLVTNLDETEAAIILQIRRKAKLSNRSRLIIHVIAESGLLYTITSFSTLWTLFIIESTWYTIWSAIVRYR